MGRVIFGIVLAAALAAGGLVSAATVRGSHFGCLTEASLTEIRDAARREDMRQVDALLSGFHCVVLSPGQEFSVVDRGRRMSKIRVYGVGGSVLLYVGPELLRDAG
ncbi:MAG: hypothetical protein Q7V31_17300 [Parvibaculum sp.]|uniref:hypothetical protein n=1 Tax=Parvibaculum sp. TaxID=2024848 RepID=UPI002715B5D0|nr:hypothetical protein [Parvibaculum sp.]MDO8840670.1 hypothetical protein [Parvibaculum sp.]